METNINQKADAEFKAKILKEIAETCNIALVARTHGLKYQTVAGWVSSHRNAPGKKKAIEAKQLERKLAYLEFENRILKELLKKTNQAKLSDDLSQIDS